MLSNRRDKQTRYEEDLEGLSTRTSRRGRADLAMDEGNGYGTLHMR